MLADCAELVGSAIEASYAISQCRREEAIRQSVCDLLNLPLEVLGSTAGGSQGRRGSAGSDTPSTSDTIMSSALQPTLSAGNGQVTGPTLNSAFDAAAGARESSRIGSDAAASLCEHLHADNVAIIDPHPTDGPTRIVGRSHPFATRNWPPDRLAALIQEIIVAAPTQGEAVCSAPEAPELEAREGIVPDGAACLAMPIRDLEGQSRLVILAISRNPDILFGNPERSYAQVRLAITPDFADQICSLDKPCSAACRLSRCCSRPTQRRRSSRKSQAS